MTTQQTSVISTIKSQLTLQLALKQEFSKRNLPELTVSHIDKTIYLCGPCGQSLCKVLFTGAARLTVSDYRIIFTKVTTFLDDKLPILSKLFTLQQKVKEPLDLIYTKSRDDIGIGIQLNKQHPDYNKHVSEIYENHIVFNIYNPPTYEYLNSAAFKRNLKIQKQYLAAAIEKFNAEKEANKIISDLSNCDI